MIATLQRRNGRVIHGVGLQRAWAPHRDPSCLCAFDADPGFYVRNGAGVSRWNDITGHGYHALQPTALNQPTWNESDADFRGHGSISFAASQGLLTGPLSHATPLTVIAAIKAPGTLTSANRTWLGDKSGPLVGINYVSTVDRYTMYNASPNTTVQGALRTDSPVVVSCKWTSSASQLRTTQSISTLFNATYSSARTYSGYSIGCASDLSRALFGKIQFLAVFSGTMSDELETKTMRWIANRLGISVGT